MVDAPDMRATAAVGVASMTILATTAWSPALFAFTTPAMLPESSTSTPTGLLLK